MHCGIYNDKVLCLNTIRLIYVDSIFLLCYLIREPQLYNLGVLWVFCYDQKRHLGTLLQIV